VANYRLTYQSVSESEGKMLDDLSAILKKHDITDNLNYAVMLVVSESFTNALVHGNQRNPEKLITLELDITENVCHVSITDEGQQGLEKIKSRGQPDLLSEGGRGIDLIELYAGSVEYIETETGGLKVSVTFDRKIGKNTKIYK
jgi:anti-sigma regulatory factor (Ser/Thr protein kinase)